MSTGIYLVDVETDQGTTRSVVIAASAHAAAEPYEAGDRRVTVGRIGTYDPGIEGARMAEYGSELVTGPVRE